MEQKSLNVGLFSGVHLLLQNDDILYQWQCHGISLTPSNLPYDHVSFSRELEINMLVVVYQ